VYVTPSYRKFRAQLIWLSLRMKLVAIFRIWGKFPHLDAALSGKAGNCLQQLAVWSHHHHQG